MPLLKMFPEEEEKIAEAGLASFEQARPSLAGRSEPVIQWVQRVGEWVLLFHLDCKEGNTKISPFPQSGWKPDWKQVNQSVACFEIHVFAVRNIQVYKIKIDQV